METKEKEFASFGEITSQPEAWAKLIPLVLEKAAQLPALFEGIEEVIFTGCGSGLNVSLAAAPVFQTKTGIAARSAPAAEIYRFPASHLNQKRRTLAILSSRSGRTTEVVNALHHFQTLGIPTIGITCTAGSPLAEESTLAFVLAPVVEQAVITTRSLSGMILINQLLAGCVAQDQAYLESLVRLPEIATRQMDAFRELGQIIGERQDLVRYAFLASGPFYGLAHECQLKVKEMVLLPADCYPALDFRHGPQSNVNPQMLVTIFFSDSAGADEASVLKDMQGLEGITWAICDKASPGMAQHADYLLEIESGLDETTRGILYLPAVQYMAYYRTIAAGMNPDEPHNLSYWIDTSH